MYFTRYSVLQPTCNKRVFSLLIFMKRLLFWKHEIYYRNPTNDLAKLRSIFSNDPETMVLTVKKWQTLRAESNGKSPRVDVSQFVERSRWKVTRSQVEGRKRYAVFSLTPNLRQSKFWLPKWNYQKRSILEMHCDNDRSSARTLSSREFLASTRMPQNLSNHWLIITSDNIHTFHTGKTLRPPFINRGPVAQPTKKYGVWKVGFVGSLHLKMVKFMPFGCFFLEVTTLCSQIKHVGNFYLRL